jgi:hypothetical protein
MLVALISLFALPFVIAANLEPMVKEAEMAAQNAPVARYSPPSQTQAQVALDDQTGQVVTANTQQNVLGVETEEKPFEIVEEKAQFSLFDKAEGNLSDTSYSLSLLKTKGMKSTGKTTLFKLTNNSSETREYSLSVVKGKTDSKANKFITLGSEEYLIGSAVVPKTIKVEANADVWFGVKSTETKLATDLTITVKLVEE